MPSIEAQVDSEYVYLETGTKEHKEVIWGSGWQDFFFFFQTRAKRGVEYSQRLSVGRAISEFVFSDMVLTGDFWWRGLGGRDVKKLTTPIANSDRVQERPVLALENFLFSKFV